MKKLFILLICCLLLTSLGYSRKIGIYTGTFNPPHAGHLNTLTTVKDVIGLDTVYMFPNYDPPHKKNITPFKHRYEMCRILAERYHWIKMTEPDFIEKNYRNGGVSNLLEKFENKYVISKRDSVYQIMGTDSFNKLVSYGVLDKVLKQRFICVVQRPGYELKKTQELKKWINAKKIILIDPSFIRKYSSTKIRKQFKEGKITEETDFFLNGYILRHGLYGKIKKLPGKTVRLGSGLSGTFKPAENVTKEISELIEKFSSKIHSYNWNNVEEYVKNSFEDEKLLYEIFFHEGEIKFIFGQESAALRYFRNTGIDNIKFLGGTSIPMYKKGNVLYLTGLKCKEQLLNCYFTVYIILKFARLKNHLTVLKLEKWNYYKMYTDIFIKDHVKSKIDTLIIGFKDFFKSRFLEIGMKFKEINDNYHEALLVKGQGFGKTLIISHFHGGGSLNEYMVLSAAKYGVKKVLFLGSAGTPMKKYKTGELIGNEKFYSYDSDFRLNSFIKSEPEAFGFRKGIDYTVGGKNLTVFSPVVESDSMIRRYGYYNFSSIDSDAMFIVKAGNSVKNFYYGILQIITNHEGKKGDKNLITQAIIKLVKKTVELL